MPPAKTIAKKTKVAARQTPSSRPPSSSARLLSSRFFPVADNSDRVDEESDDASSGGTSEEDAAWDEEQTANFDSIECTVCGSTTDEAQLIICDGDGCDSAQHTFCCTPVLDAVPSGEWYCDECTECKTCSAPRTPRV